MAVTGVAGLFFYICSIFSTFVQRETPARFPASRPAARVLATLLDKLRSASGGGRRGQLALVRTMSEHGGARWPAVDQDHE
jgi:hypothetical protein